MHREHEQSDSQLSWHNGWAASWPPLAASWPRGLCGLCVPRLCRPAGFLSQGNHVRPAVQPGHEFFTTTKPRLMCLGLGRCVLRIACCLMCIVRRSAHLRPCGFAKAEARQAGRLCADVRITCKSEKGVGMSTVKSNKKAVFVSSWLVGRWYCFGVSSFRSRITLEVPCNSRYKWRPLWKQFHVRARRRAPELPLWKSLI